MSSFEANVQSAMPHVTEPSKTPRYVAIGICVLSILIALIFDNSLVLSIMGYILTPFGVVGCLLWARAEDLKKSPDPYYDRTKGGFKKYTFIDTMQFATGVAFLIGIIHIWRIATEIATR